MTFDDVAYCYTSRIVEDTWYLNIYETLFCIGDLSSVRSGQKDNFNRVNGEIFRCLLIGGFAIYFKDTVTCGDSYRTKY